ncbi:nitrous oxide reductase family maturation protein NosD [Evansella clarkii]|uniref:nitrous oxide reductase family maturation protein NosD n=1 Tax=Evansella clarkii TaxID=79879 RepID=UPI000998853E|nr:nitrous oxide reductase family maturation protein NosD [Evansella clarkii]
MKRLVFICFLLIFFFIPARAMAGGELQKMIDAADDYETILLENKVYEGNIVIGKPLIVTGAEETVIRGDGTGNVVTIESPDVHLEQLQIENSSFARGDGEEYSGIKVNTDGNSFRKLIITDSYHGIYLSQAHENIIDQVEIHGQMDQETIAGQGNGIQVYYSERNTLTDNYIEGTRDGMYFEYAHQNTISGNEISHTRYGLHYMYSDDNRFQDNSFTFNIGGAAVMHSSRNEFTGNKFSMNQSSRSFGFMLQASSENHLEGNQFIRNKRGLLVEQARGNYIYNNEFSQNDIGVEMWASSSQQIFTENKFYKNRSPVVQVGGESESSWNEAGRGNDWGSDFPLADLDQNGTGDFSVAYQSSLHQLLEENELSYLLLNSPSIAVYEKMNQWMNNQRTMFQDDFPLQNREVLPVMKYSALILVISGALFGVQRRRRSA